jgi:hypothetical protein
MARMGMAGMAHRAMNWQAVARQDHETARLDTAGVEWRGQSRQGSAGWGETWQREFRRVSGKRPLSGGRFFFRQSSKRKKTPPKACLEEENQINSRAMIT